MSTAHSGARRVRAGARPAAVAVAVTGAAAALAGCTTTQERSALLSSQASKAAKAKQFTVGRTNRDVTAKQVRRLEGDGGAAAVVVQVVNRTKEPQASVPIGVDLWDAKDVSLYSNRIDGWIQRSTAFRWRRRA